MRLILTTLVLLTILPALHAQVPSYVPTNGLVGWWPFNGNANDESGNGNNGTVNGATLTADRFGNVNSAYFFNGTGVHINLGPVTGFLATNPFTVAAWVNIDPSSTVAGVRPILYRGDFAESNQLGFGTHGNNPSCGASFIMRVSNSQNPLFTTLNVQNGLWNHIVWIHEGLGEIKIYVNQQLAGSMNVGSMVNHNFNLMLGRLGNTNNQAYNGLSDDPGIWNRALTVAEIQAIYSAGQTVSSPKIRCVG